MERFAADALTLQRRQQVRAALKAKVPWTEVMEDYGLSMAEILDLAERQTPVFGEIKKVGSAIITQASETDIRDARAELLKRR